MENNCLWAITRFQATTQSNEASIDIPVEDNSLWATPIFQSIAQSNKASTKVPIEDSSSLVTPMFQATTQPNEESLTIPEMEAMHWSKSSSSTVQATFASIVDQAFVQGNVAI